MQLSSHNEPFEQRPYAAQQCTCPTAAHARCPTCLQAAAIGGEQQLRVLCSDAQRNRFFEYDDIKNVYGG